MIAPCFPAFSGALRFDTAVFQIAGSISDIVSLDINGDHRCDFVVLHQDHSAEGRISERFLSVFIQKENGLSGKPDQTVLLNRGEIFFQLVDVNRDSAAELVFLTEKGVFQKTWTNDSGFVGWMPLIRSRSVFPHADPQKVMSLAFIQDLDADGANEIFVPQAGWMEVYRPNDSGAYAMSQKLAVSPDYTFPGKRELFYSIRLPRWVIRDFNGDGALDLFFIRENTLDVFIQHRDYRFNCNSLLPPDLRFRFDYSNEMGNVHNPPVSVLVVEDINGDSRADVIEVQGSRSLRVFLNRRGRFNSIPDQILSADQVSFGYAIRDFNRDGLPDLAFVELSTGLKSLTQFVFYQKYQRIFKCFYSRPDSTFAEKPDFQLAFKQKFQLNDPTGKNAFLSFDGDFTGDGIPDMAVGSDPHVLDIFEGLSNGGFGKKPVLKIHTSVSGDFRITDMNGDGVSDVFYWFPGNSGMAGRVFLIQSKRLD